MYPYPLYGGLVSYGTLTLTETSPPQSFSEPLTLSDIKTHLHLPDGDSLPDEELKVFITAAREQVEIYQNCDLVRKQWDLALDYWPCEQRIELRAPLVSVDLGQYTDSSGNVVVLAENTHYIVDVAKRPGVILPAYNTPWPAFTPRPSSAILWRFTSGYAVDSLFWSARGARAKVAMKYLVTEWFVKRLPEGQRNDVAERLAGCGAVPRVK